jgi:hypothetical protein
MAVLERGADSYEPGTHVALPQSGLLTTLKSTCWVWGSHPSTLGRIRARCQQSGETETDSYSAGPSLESVLVVVPGFVQNQKDRIKDGERKRKGWRTRSRVCVCVCVCLCAYTRVCVHLRVSSRLTLPPASARKQVKVLPPAFRGEENCFFHLSWSVPHSARFRRAPVQIKDLGGIKAI